METRTPYTYKDIKQTFDRKAKTWTLSLAGYLQTSFDGRRSRPPRRDTKETFLAHVNEDVARYPIVCRPTAPETTNEEVKHELPICSLYHR